MRSMILFLLLLLSSWPDTARSAFVCNPDGTQTEMNVCAIDSMKAAESELDSVYREVLACGVGNPVFVKNMEAAQRLWVQFRDAELEARFPVGPGEIDRVLYGSMYPMSWATEKETLAKERTGQLRRYIEDDALNLYCDPTLLKNNDAQD